jgi:hypothetical protein
MAKRPFVPEFWKEKKNAKPRIASESSQSANSKEKIDYVSGSPLLGESEKSGLFMLCSKPESEEGLAECVPFLHSFGFSPDIA